MTMLCNVCGVQCMYALLNGMIYLTVYISTIFNMMYCTVCTYMGQKDKDGYYAE